MDCQKMGLLTMEFAGGGMVVTQADQLVAVTDGAVHEIASGRFAPWLTLDRDLELRVTDSGTTWRYTHLGGLACSCPGGGHRNSQAFRLRYRLPS